MSRSGFNQLKNQVHRTHLEKVDKATALAGRQACTASALESCSPVPHIQISIRPVFSVWHIFPKLLEGGIGSSN